MPKTKPDLERKIALAALRLAASYVWKDVALDQVAKAAKVPLSSVKNLFSTTNDILPAIVRYVTAETIASAGKQDRHAQPRDRLFDVMMARFDVLQTHRKAILGIMAAARCDSKMLCAVILEQEKAMKAVLGHAGLGQKGGQTPLATAGLGLVYLAALRVWSHDETLDMAKTMAALDRYLRWASRLAETLLHER